MPNQHEALADRYRSMSDMELNLLAEDANDLTDGAREALRSEYARRGLTMPEPETGEWDSQQLVVVERFLNLHEALLAKGQFDSAGIPAFLIDDNMVRIDWFISNLLGGVKLAVAPEHEAEARELLAQPIPENFDVEGVGEYEQPHCPKCQSLDISFESLDKTLAYGSAWVGVPIPFGANRWRCHECGARWEADESIEPSSDQLS